MVILQQFLRVHPFLWDEVRSSFMAWALAASRQSFPHLGRPFPPTPLVLAIDLSSLSTTADLAFSSEKDNQTGCSVLDSPPKLPP